jgi:hypothetical protein
VALPVATQWLGSILAVVAVLLSSNAAVIAAWRSPCGQMTPQSFDPIISKILWTPSLETYIPHCHRALFAFPAPGG